MKQLFSKLSVLVFVFSALSGIGAGVAFHQPKAAAAAKVYAKYAWSPCIYDVSGKPRYVPKSEYDAAGRPSVWTVSRMAGDDVVRFKTSPSEIFLGQPKSAPYYTCAAKHLTRAEWNALGNPTPRNLANEFIKIPNNNVIYMGSYGGDYVPLSHSQWAFYGYPTPEQRRGF